MIRKKACPKCGRKLWLRDFYKSRNGVYSSYCKECVKAQKRTWYNENKKVADGVRRNPDTGLLMVKQGISLRIYWSRQMLDEIIRYFPTMINEELAGMLGVSQRTLIRKARELGLEKDKEWLLKKWDEHRMVAHVISKKKGYPGAFRKGEHAHPEGEYKKGHTLTPEQEKRRVEALRSYRKRKIV